ncbi:MAG: hypothetical protein LBV79_08525 [Candidatus Adiutrix sp.]|jgi:hypothetical protein|nr:hypothetical protein [Candidatus Adiutrix sp.]
MMNLTSLAAYAESCRRLAERDFAGLRPVQVAARSEEYNAYPGLERLEPPRSLIILEDRLSEAHRERARRAVLDGLIFWEHTAAGEATRLKLGPKYLIDPADRSGVMLAPDYLAGGLVEPIQAGGYDHGETINRLKGLINQIRPLTLGARHLWQWAFEVTRLAKEYGLDPQTVLARQRTLLIVSEAAKDQIFAHVVQANFLGLKPENFFFMVQPGFHGLTPGASGWDFDPATPQRLHNHGQMAMQKTMDGQILRLDSKARPQPLSRDDYFSLLAEAADLVSYNIEDLGYLTRALDFDTIGLALDLGDEGFGMTMEIVANNPERPIKGGSCAYDPALGRDVVIESFRLRGLAPSRISHLNKNFNHYPNPAQIFRKLHEEALFMPVNVADEAVYFQPVQGDLNFLARTAFITRRVPTAIRAWKAPQDTLAALEAMTAQDRQPGFAEFIHNKR